MMEKDNKNRDTRKVAYYPGCTLTSTAIDFNVSLKELLKVLDIGYMEIDDWNCCGTTPAYNTSQEMAAILSARNLMLAREMGIEEILSPCVSCYNKLHKAAYYINSSSELKDRREKEIRDSILTSLADMDFDISGEMDFRVYSIIEFLYLKRDDIGRKYRELQVDETGLLESSILSGLNPACYYGCALLRAGQLKEFDDMERPSSMEKILSESGIHCIDFPFKTECCGAILSLSNKDQVLRLGGKILDAAVESGADSLIVFCPLCQQNLDLRQKQINRYNNTQHRIPVLYITQVLGLALGLTYEQVMMDKLFVPAEHLKNRKTIKFKGR